MLFFLKCFKFHLYIGIRSGGGIGDELESPVGDSMEFYRIIFDITFFFFIIVILLAIIQGEKIFKLKCSFECLVLMTFLNDYRFDYRCFWRTKRSIKCSSRNIRGRLESNLGI